MQKITTFLTFNDQAEEAAKLYTSIFRNAEITRVSRSGGDDSTHVGGVISVAFILDGQEFMALNGGPHFSFANGTSLFVTCDTQSEVDEYWEKLTQGGEPGPCGWLKDKFGVSWQIVPSALSRLLSDKDPEKAKRVMQALLKMSKLDIRTLEEA